MTLPPDLRRACLERLRTTSRIDYFAALLHGHDATIVLRAFHGEIASIPFKVRDPMAGEVRLQWWRDVVSGERDEEGRADPVSHALVTLLGQHADWRAPLLTKLAAHETDLYADPFPDWNAYEGYAGETRSVLFQLGALNLDPSASVAEASGHAGVAEAIADRLAAWPLFQERTAPALPSDTANPNEIVRKTATRGLNHVRSAKLALNAVQSNLETLYRRLSVDERRLVAAEADPERAIARGITLPQISLQWRLWRGV